MACAQVVEIKSKSIKLFYRKININFLISKRIDRSYCRRKKILLIEKVPAKM